LTGRRLRGTDRHLIATVVTRYGSVVEPADRAAPDDTCIDDGLPAGGSHAGTRHRKDADAPGLLQVALSQATVDSGRTERAGATSLRTTLVPTGESQPPTLVYLVGRLNHGIRRELQRRLATHNLSLPELTALSGLQRRPGLSTARLARRSLVTPQAMNIIIAELETRGLVQRRVDPSHRRILEARLTPAGRGLLRRVDPIVEALETELLQDVPKAERDAVMRGLTAAMRRVPMIEGMGRFVAAAPRINTRGPLT
jgi:DNA-binding MarR family transcriptional regulator